MSVLLVYTQTNDTTCAAYRKLILEQNPFKKVPGRQGELVKTGLLSLSYYLPLSTLKGSSKTCHTDFRATDQRAIPSSNLIVPQNGNHQSQFNSPDSKYKHIHPLPPSFICTSTSAWFRLLHSKGY